MPPFKWLQDAIKDTPVAVNTNSGTDLGGLATMFANVAIIIGMGVSLVGLAYSFVIFTTSGGDPKSVERGKRAATWSVIGLLVSGAAWGIKTIFFGLMGAEGFVL